MSREQEERGLSTADLVAAGEGSAQRTADSAPQQMVDDRTQDSRMPEARAQDPAARNSRPQSEPLAALFTPDVARDFQSRWDGVQIGFVDDPRDAVRQADELVAQVMKSLAESFANEREGIERQLDSSDSQATENMRMALHRYRSFFQRLLSL